MILCRFSAGERVRPFASIFQKSKIKIKVKYVVVLHKNAVKTISFTSFFYIFFCAIRYFLAKLKPPSH